MRTITEQELFENFDKAVGVIQEVALGNELEQTVITLGKIHRVDLGKFLSLKNIIIYSMLKIISKEEMLEALVSELGETEDRALQLFTDIDNFVFKKVNFSFDETTAVKQLEVSSIEPVDSTTVLDISTQIPEIKISNLEAESTTNNSFVSRENSAYAPVGYKASEANVYTNPPENLTEEALYIAPDLTEIKNVEIKEGNSTLNTQAAPSDSSITTKRIIDLGVSLPDVNNNNNNNHLEGSRAAILLDIENKAVNNSKAEEFKLPEFMSPVTKDNITNFEATDTIAKTTTQTLNQADNITVAKTTSETKDIEMIKDGSLIQNTNTITPITPSPQAHQTLSRPSPLKAAADISGSRSQLMDKLGMLSNIPEEDAILERLEKIRNYSEEAAKKVDTVEVVDELPIVPATARPEALSKPPVTYTVDPYRELADEVY